MLAIQQHANCRDRALLHQAHGSLASMVTHLQVVVVLQSGKAPARPLQQAAVLYGDSASVAAHLQEVLLQHASQTGASKGINCLPAAQLQLPKLPEGARAQASGQLRRPQLTQNPGRVGSLVLWAHLLQQAAKQKRQLADSLDVLPAEHWDSLLRCQLHQGPRLASSHVAASEGMLA